MTIDLNSFLDSRVDLANGVWYSGSKCELGDQVSNTLDTSAALTGTYTFTFIKDGYCCIEKQITINNPDIVIGTVPSKCEDEINDPVLISVQVSNSFPYVVQWYKNDNYIGHGDQIYVTPSTGKSIYTAKVITGGCEYEMEVPITVYESIDLGDPLNITMCIGDDPMSKEQIIALLQVAFPVGAELRLWYQTPVTVDGITTDMIGQIDSIDPSNFAGPGTYIITMDALYNNSNCPATSTINLTLDNPVSSSENKQTDICK